MRKYFARLSIVKLTLIISLVVITSQACPVSDNGTGTVTLLPVGCEFTSPQEVFMIIDGLPPSTIVEMEGIIKDSICCDPPCPECSLPVLPGQCETYGSSLGGNGHCFNATLDLTVSGTGDLIGFNRHLSMPIFCEVHTGPRNPGDPVQALPSGDFAVDSFFDITYQIEFTGSSSSLLDGLMGITTATIRMQTGSGKLTVSSCVGFCDDCDFCFKTTTVNPDGSIDICCDCIPDADLNRDGIVDLHDLGILAKQWLTIRP